MQNRRNVNRVVGIRRPEIVLALQTRIGAVSGAEPAAR
jgi:hypothetical protein